MNQNKNGNGYDDLLEMQDFEDSDNYEELGHSPAQLQQQYGNQMPSHSQQMNMNNQIIE